MTYKYHRRDVNILSATTISSSFCPSFGDSFGHLNIYNSGDVAESLVRQ